MSTARHIVARAMAKIGILGKGETLQAEDAEAGLASLNEMLFSWKLRDVDVTHSALDIADTFPLDDEYHEGVILNLATRLSAEYQLPASFDADAWFRGIQAAYSDIPEMTNPLPVVRVPSYEDRNDNLPSETT